METAQELRIKELNARDCLKCRLKGKTDWEIATYLSENSLPFTVKEFKKILNRYHTWN